MKVRITRAAEADLQAIAEWIGRDNPARAIGFVDELVERCRSLSEHPDRFPVHRELRGRIVRKMTHQNYVILYARVADRVEIVHVVHGARNVDALLG